MLVMFDVTCPREGVRTMTTAEGKGEVIDLNSKLCAPANLPIAVCTRKISVLVVPNHYISPVLKPEWPSKKSTDHRIFCVQQGSCRQVDR